VLAPEQVWSYGEKKIVSCGRLLVVVNYDLEFLYVCVAYVADVQGQLLPYHQDRSR
jgi:hypothetical protein